MAGGKIGCWSPEIWIYVSGQGFGGETECWTLGWGFLLLKELFPSEQGCHRIPSLSANAVTMFVGKKKNRLATYQVAAIAGAE